MKWSHIFLVISSDNHRFTAFFENCGRLFENIVISALKPKLAKHREFGELSKKFVMVNTDDNEEPQGEQFDVDGKYVPRIFLLGNINVLNLA